MSHFCGSFVGLRVFAVVLIFLWFLVVMVNLAIVALNTLNLTTDTALNLKMHSHTQLKFNVNYGRGGVDVAFNLNLK